jgi:multidrug efflux pump subunit AcrB
MPMGLPGVIVMLWITGTTLNIESHMGVIVMMIGIVVSNSILLVDFANERRRWRKHAQVNRRRLRHSYAPHPGTATATIMALVPIAMKLGTTSGTSTPLGRAALGGLAVFTIFTLVLVPCIHEAFILAAPEDGVLGGHSP